MQQKFMEFMKCDLMFNILSFIKKVNVFSL